MKKTMNNNHINIVLADDHAIVRNGIKSLIESENDIRVIGEASNGKEAMDVSMRLRPDVLVMDISMPEMTGLEAVELLNKNAANIKIMMLSMHDREEYVLKAIDIGAYGYMLKDSSKEDLLKAIRSIANGEKYFSSDISNIIVNKYLNISSDSEDRVIHRSSNTIIQRAELTKRERSILKLIVEGNNNRQIAEEFSISVRTIETHRFNIMKKLKVKNAVELVKIAIEEGIC